jgi:hypothetical protein
MGSRILDLLFIIVTPIIGAIAILTQFDKMKRRTDSLDDKIKELNCKTFLDLQFNRIKGYKSYKDN